MFVLNVPLTKLQIIINYFIFFVLKVKEHKVGQGPLEEDRAHCGSKNDVKLPPASLPVSFSFLLPKLAIDEEIVFKRFKSVC